MTFQEWLEGHKDEIEKIQKFTKSELPVSPVAIHDDLSQTTREYPRASEFLADVDQFLTMSRAHETLKVRSEGPYAGFTAQERKATVEGRLASILRVRDVLKATIAALHQRSFALLNQRRYAEAEMRMTPHQG